MSISLSNNLLALARPIISPVKNFYTFFSSVASPVTSFVFDLIAGFFAPSGSIAHLIINDITGSFFLEEPVPANNNSNS